MSPRPEESLCSSLSCRCNPWTCPYISMLPKEQSTSHVPATPVLAAQSVLQLEPWPCPRDTACQPAGSVWPGREGRPEFLSFPLWLFQDFSVEVFTGWVGPFYQSQILAGWFPGRSFSPRSPWPEPADLTYLPKSSTAWPKPRAASGLQGETAGTANPPRRRTGFWVHLRNNA